jgi:predicted SAM-dependent methyltransferase
MSSNLSGFLDRTANRIRLRWQRFNAFRSLRRRIHHPPVKIIIGSSGTIYPGWIQTEVEFLNLLVDSDWERCFGDVRIDAMLAEHVWEHLNRSDGQKAAEQCFAYLKPGGYLRIAIPDGYHPDPKYIEHVRIGGSGPGADDHKMLYTTQSVLEVFSGVGFEVEFLENFDENGQFHEQAWNPEDGHIQRSRRFDSRNNGGQLLAYTSLIFDAKKPKQ